MITKVRLNVAKNQIEELFKRTVEKHERFIISVPDKGEQVMMIQLGDISRLKALYGDFDDIEELIDNILEVNSPNIQASIRESWKEYKGGKVGTRKDILKMIAEKG